MKTIPNSNHLSQLRILFGDRLQENVTLADYTTARVGGKADAVVIAQSVDELVSAVETMWKASFNFHILGAGSNILASDRGVRGLVIINRARNIRVDMHGNPPIVRAESGASFSGIARRASLRGLSGLEWAGTIPGTVGGAVYGNAGAFGSDVQHNLLLAEILHRKYGKQTWNCEHMAYGYRTSILKQQTGQAVILSATFSLNASTPEEVKGKMDSFANQRRRTQPVGASLGSMFKNPSGDYAGRLIEAAGLKGTRIGGVHISTKHANFFINDEHATATDYYQLIRQTQETVYQQFGVQLELEVELLGDWQIPNNNFYRSGDNE